MFDKKSTPFSISSKKENISHIIQPIKRCFYTRNRIKKELFKGKKTSTITQYIQFILE